jgi:hypothetical protein
MKNLLQRTEPKAYEPWAPGAEKAIAFTQEHVPNVQPALLRSEATGGRIDGILHSVAETGIIPPKRLVEYTKNRHQEFANAARDFGEQISRTPMSMEERAELILKAAEREKGLYNSAASVYYNTIREKVSPTRRTVAVPVGEEGTGLRGPSTQFVSSATTRRTDIPTATGGPPNPNQPAIPQPGTRSQITGIDATNTIIPGREYMRPVTKDVELTSGGLIVDVRELRKKYHKQLKAIGEDPQGVEGKAALEQFYDLGDYAQWSDLEPVLQRMRSDSRRIDMAVNAGGQAGKERAPGAARLDALANNLDDVMGEALKTVPTAPGSSMSLYEVWKIARGMSRTAHQDFNNELLRSLTKSALYNAKGGNLTVAKTLYEAKEPDIVRQALRPLDETERQEIRKGAWEYAWQQALTKLPGSTDMVMAKDLRKYLYGQTDLDIKRANEFFTPQQRKWIDGYLATIEKHQERLADPMSPVFFQMKQAGAVAEVSGAAMVGLGVQAGEKLSKGKVGVGLTLLFSPKMAANLLLRPTTAELYTQLSKYPTNSYAFGATLKRLSLFDEGVARLVQAAVSTQLAPQATGAAADMIQQGVGTQPFPNFK